MSRYLPSMFFLFVCFLSYNFIQISLMLQIVLMAWWALKTLHPEFLLIIFLFVVLLIMLWGGGGGARCFFKVQFNSSESAFAKGTLLRYSATEWQMHRQRGRLMEMRSHYCSSWMSLWARWRTVCVWEGWGGGGFLKQIPEVLLHHPVISHL